ncbi:hypothetical protein J6590_072227 [Homalodisca vitripennis]|nr:hypothetical protein J6590_072227 [Homalodisca vitripennis]
MLNSMDGTDLSMTRRAQGLTNQAFINGSVVLVNNQLMVPLRTKYNFHAAVCDHFINRYCHNQHSAARRYTGKSTFPPPPPPEP